MSPLVRSLLALATLFAAAASDPCTYLKTGRGDLINVPLPPVVLHPPGARIDIPDNCPSVVGINLHRVGEYITACNNDATGLPPAVYADPSNQMQHVNVVCIDGCPLGVTVTVKEYCSVFHVVGPNAHH